MTTVRCTAPTLGHARGSQAERECPVHGDGTGHVSTSLGNAAPVPPPGRTEPLETSLMPSDEWDDLIHRAGTALDSDGTILDDERLEFVKEALDEAENQPRITMSKAAYHRLAADGQSVFNKIHFLEDMAEADTRGQVFVDCDFSGDIVLGDRALFSGCRMRSARDSSVTEKGGRVAAIVEHCSFAGNVKLSGSSIVALKNCEVGGDLVLEGGNGLHAVFVDSPDVGGVLVVDDSEAVVLNNGYGTDNVIGFLGSASELAKRNAMVNYTGPSPEEATDDGPEVHFFSYDDLQEASQHHAQGDIEGERHPLDVFAEMDERVKVGARALRERVDKERATADAY